MAAGNVAPDVCGPEMRSNRWWSAWPWRTEIWGYRRIQGALANLGHEVARGTIANILKEHGLEPAPERERKTTWREFLSRHRDVIVAADFFTLEAWTRKGLTTFLVLFLINLSSRRVEIAGVARSSRIA